jgi:hypothetical protein
MVSASDAGDVRIVDREDVRRTRRQLFGFTVPDLDILEGDEQDKEASEMLETTVTSARQLTNMAWRFTTAENAVWEITNAPARFRPIKAGDTVIFNGVVGAFTPTGGTSASSRDLDWLRMSVSEPCYIAVTLSMGRDVEGVRVPFASPDQSYISIYSGSEQASAKSLSFGFDTDGCPHNPVVRLPNGTQAGKIPLPAGDATFVVTTPFNPTGTTQYNGPIYYSLKVEVLALDNGQCGTATNDCVTASGTGGCSDATCCDTVCGFNPECCNVAWDTACIDYGVTQCGNFVFRCDAPVAENDCLTSAAPVDVTGGAITFGFDNTGANTDGPNNVNTQCSSTSARDICCASPSSVAAAARDPGFSSSIWTGGGRACEAARLANKTPPLAVGSGDCSGDACLGDELLLLPLFSHLRNAEGTSCDISRIAGERGCVFARAEESTLPPTMHTHVMSSRSPFARKAFDTIRSAA